MNHTIYKLVFATLSIILISPKAALAQNPTRQAIREQNIQNICEKVSTRVDNLQKRITNTEEARKLNHQKAIDRISSIISKLETNGADTTKLKTQLTTLIQKRDTWQTEYAGLKTKLEATKQFACGKSQGDYKQSVKDAQSQRRVMQTANQDFWNYIKNTIKPEIKTSRNSIKTSSDN